ncbi:hypothetical protein ADK59_10220, partial [Streptomyces sp. XY332]
MQAAVLGQLRLDDVEGVVGVSPDWFANAIAAIRRTTTPTTVTRPREARGVRRGGPYGSGGGAGGGGGGWAPPPGSPGAAAPAFW